MWNIKDKIYDWKDRLRSGKMLTLVCTLVIIILALGIYAYRKSRDYQQLAENNYNHAFYQLIEYMDDTEKLLAKSTISYSSEHATETFSNINKETALAQAYLSRLPIDTQELENTQKFLHQVGDYCYTLSKKTVKGEKLSQEELDNLTQLHQYSVNLRDVLYQLEADLFSSTIRWGELEDAGSMIFSREDETLTQSSFSNIEDELHQYSGLIYDGAYSEGLENTEMIGLTGEDVSQEKAESIARDFIGNDKVEEINFTEESQNANIQCYNFNVNTKNEDENYSISVSKKGGHVVAMNCDRQVADESISPDDAVNKGKEFLQNREYKNMKDTYYMKENGILTVNYAYMQDDVIMYPDLIKLKIALDNGEILGLESTRYLNCHKDNRELSDVKVSEEKARELINPKLEITGTNLAIIPTEWNTEIMCWEITGKTEENDFLVYINVETGEEEDILMIVNTPNGTLTT